MAKITDDYKSLAGTIRQLGKTIAENNRAAIDQPVTTPETTATPSAMVTSVQNAISRNRTLQIRSKIIDD
jgi:hypothetical protein